MLLISLTYWIINIAVVIWIAIDANKRGYETVYVWLWGALAFWFGILVLIIYLIVRPRDIEMEICSACRKKLVGDPYVCPHCGTFLKEEPVDMSYQGDEGNRDKF